MVDKSRGNATILGSMRVVRLYTPLRAFPRLLSNKRIVQSKHYIVVGSLWRTKTDVMTPYWSMDGTIFKKESRILQRLDDAVMQKRAAKSVLLVGIGLSVQQRNFT